MYVLPGHLSMLCTPVFNFPDYSHFYIFRVGAVQLRRMRMKILSRSLSLLLCTASSGSGSDSSSDSLVRFAKPDQTSSDSDNISHSDSQVCMLAPKLDVPCRARLDRYYFQPQVPVWMLTILGIFCTCIDVYNT